MGEITTLRQRLNHHAAVEKIIGRSPPIMEILKKLPSIARSDASVVIFGESGTGKELAARAIHALSPRVEKPFLPVDCGALPESLLENELFGHMKGAFTDAHRNHLGLIQEADKGTLFLDEIGEIGLPVQVKLLRFLQEREFRPLGSTKSLKVDVRIISATNKDLRKAIQDGTFREDLYYRLNIIPLTLPPLRSRKEDIPTLVNHFLARSAAEFGRRDMSVSPLAMQKLSSYDWPGNIRELENKIQQLVALSETNIILPNHVEFDVMMPDTSLDEISTFKEAKAEVVKRFEVRYIERLLALNGGNVTRSANQAGKHRRAFWELMKKHCISAERSQRAG
jgi:two-component system response regulator GlrR